MYKKSDRDARRHHLDRRADVVAAAAAGRDADELMTTPEVARWLGVSENFLQIGRAQGGYGPRFVRLSTTMVRYRRGDVLEWLRQRTHASTAEYDAGRKRAS